MSSFLDLIALTLGLALVGLLYKSRSKTAYPLPPGPRRLPIIGNMLDMPKRNEWATYRKWGKDHGSDIIHLEVLGTHLIILNSEKAANDLLNKRSSIYSDRPKMAVIVRLGWSLGFVPYGQRWRDMRKAFHQYFHPTATLQYHPIEERATVELLKRLLDTPEDFIEHLRHMTGRIILEITYGIKVQPHGDPYIDAAERALEGKAFGSTTRAGLYDILPFLQRVPAWVPGNGFIREAKKWTQYCLQAPEGAYHYVKEGIANGTAGPSVVASMIKKNEYKQSNYDEEIAKYTAGSMYLGNLHSSWSSQQTLTPLRSVKGGADTTMSALGTFFLAMVLHPEVQRKAQAEIDAVIGNDRLPNFEDENSLPYVNAVVKEVLRWRPVVTLVPADLAVLPHRLISDDVYKGYHIPAGSIVIGNAGAMLHDELTFPEADKFKPEHFLDTSSKFPEVAFGFGRRICPGRYMARGSIWIAIASILATLDISKAVDKDGKVIELIDEYSSGVISYPAPFRCAIKPRSPEAEELIRRPETADQ
ncbi:hypothetical protein EW146_g5474 [Bondarzewia mesenterica]|uniref:Cytochrome P450 n=1 Tax=Bondarzewia mesenterica TaxID=1095465 RepID=A0A4S4LRB6_9AGAM|nr:hypothetical protein EW146_g5474 [Bondarzewia mesenterica]